MLRALRPGASGLVNTRAGWERGSALGTASSDWLAMPSGERRTYRASGNADFAGRELAGRPAGKDGNGEKSFRESVMP